MVRWLLLLILFTTAHAQQPFLILLVDAPHFNYNDSNSLLATWAKHPATGCKRGHVGHAWIYLAGERGIFEGGHSGETGVVNPKYLEGIARRADEGSPNPAAYLWESLDDGFLQIGNGGHRPTYAVAITLNALQYDAIARFVDPRCYPYRCYSLTRRQCVSFVAQVAALAGLELDVDVTVGLPPHLHVGPTTLPLWRDPAYSTLSFASPDRLETSLKRAVAQGLAQPVLQWYLRHHSVTESEPWYQTLLRFPKRMARYWALTSRRRRGGCQECSSACFDQELQSQPGRHHRE